MAGKLPPRELYVVVRAVVPLDDEELPLAFRMSEPMTIPAGTICQILKMEPQAFCAEEATIYYVDDVTSSCEIERVPIDALRPYNPEKDTPKEEAVKSDELPPRGPCVV